MCEKAATYSCIDTDGLVYKLPPKATTATDAIEYGCCWDHLLLELLLLLLYMGRRGVPHRAVDCGGEVTEKIAKRFHRH